MLLVVEEEVLLQLVLMEQLDQVLHVVVLVVLVVDFLIILELQVNLQVHFIIFLVELELDQEAVQLLLPLLEV